MAIKDWPAEQRPREKLLKLGASAMSDVELLAIFLRVGIKGQSAVDLAQHLIDEFGSLRAILAANKQDFCQGHGLGEAKYTQVQAILEMAKRHFMEELKRGDVLSSPEATRAYLSAELRGYSYEVFACLFLDNQHRVIEFEVLFKGSLQSASVYPREVAKRALYHNTAAVIFAHNHPSGITTPSGADKKITEKLKQGLNLFDIQVLDHFIIGDGELYSFAEQGLL